MAKTTMPAAEAEMIEVGETNSYELAFHVLPTVAEGEVLSVFEEIKDKIIKTGAEIFDQEAPERFDLAYEVVKHYEGKNRKFKSAYFGWVRFKTAPEAIASISEAVEDHSSILRHLLIKLTRVEEETPFRFHEVIASQKMVTDVAEVSLPEEVEAVVAEETEVVDEVAIDEALDKSAV